MPNPSTTPQGNIKGNWLLSPTLSPISVAPATSVEQTFTVTGLNMGDFVDVAKPTAQVGLSLGNARVSAANTLALTYVNSSTGTLTPTAAEVYAVCVTRPDNLNSTSTGALLTQIT
jgi:hypothetical protein